MKHNEHCAPFLSRPLNVKHTERLYRALPDLTSTKSHIVVAQHVCIKLGVKEQAVKLPAHQQSCHDILMGIMGV